MKVEECSFELEGNTEGAFSIEIGNKDGNSLTFSADGEEADVYLLGVSQPVEKYKGRVIAVIHRLDDVEDKWIAAPTGVTFPPDEIEKAVNFQEQYFQHEIEMLDPNGDQ
ncbi:MAG: hypothetical protein BHV98_01340 [Clostridium sp. CAG:217_53_7]|nr:MAG: hypothetical protein BHV98_01340 [Clostridium sp. CAG:217_53_7]